MLGVIENHVNRFVFKHDLMKSSDVLMVDISVQLSTLSANDNASVQLDTHRNLSNCALTEPRIRVLALLIRLELLHSIECTIAFLPFLLLRCRQGR